LIAGNWKMNLNHLEAIALVQKLAFALPEKYFAEVEVAVLPPFTALRSVQTLITGDKLLIRYGAQDLHPKDSGAYTGDVSGPMLAKMDCSYVVVGHSERRQHHHEDDALVAAKVRAALRNGLVPILCVGEGLEIRETGQVQTIVVAYEPIWAIGTGRVATPADAQEVCGALRATLADKYSAEVADEVRVLYGGSVKSSNVADLVAEPDIDGALVGGASLDGDEFAKLCALAAGGPLV
jgi:triosephosphate isomerase